MRTLSLIIALLFFGNLCLPAFDIAPIASAQGAAGGGGAGAAGGGGAGAAGGGGAGAAGGGAIFQGGGLRTGIDRAQGITGVSGRELRPLIVNAITVTVNLLGILAAASIIICGILLIFSFGDETAKEKAKKGVLYSAIGLLVILFAKAIVTFITQLG